MAKRKPTKREYIVTMNVELHGCTAFVMATSEDEAIEIANAGNHGELETNAASMANWEATDAELNE